jgi:hypothetical protein
VTDTQPFFHAGAARRTITDVGVDEDCVVEWKGFKKLPPLGKALAVKYERAYFQTSVAIWDDFS